MKWYLILLIILVTIPTTLSICCEKRKECIISETCQEANCGECLLNIYNRDGTINVSGSNMTSVTLSTYIYNISTNLSVYGIYPYTINCTSGGYCRGDCQVEVKQECEEQEGMTTGIVLFLLLFNIGLFITPVLVKQFTKNPASNYVVRKIIIMIGILVLWFNSLIFRQLAINFGLGIDNYLIAYWWFFTLAVFIVIFVMCYVVVIGGIQLARQTRIEKRMGEKDGEKRF